MLYKAMRKEKLIVIKIIQTLRSKHFLPNLFPSSITIANKEATSIPQVGSARFSPV